MSNYLQQLMMSDLGIFLQSFVNLRLVPFLHRNIICNVFAIIYRPQNVFIAVISGCGTYSTITCFVFFT